MTDISPYLQERDDKWDFERYRVDGTRPVIIGRLGCTPFLAVWDDRMIFADLEPETARAIAAILVSLSDTAETRDAPENDWHVLLATQRFLSSGGEEAPPTPPAETP